MSSPSRRLSKLLGAISVSILFACPLLCSCAGRASVPRRSGVVVEWGRPISGNAYAWYVRGIVAEHQDRVPEARYSFAQAVHEDPAGAAAYAALIRLDCENSPIHVQRHLKWGVEKAVRPGVVLGAAAACALRNDEPARARELAERALRLEPLLASANETYAELLVLSGDGRRAARWRRAYRLAAQNLWITQNVASSQNGVWRAPTSPTHSVEAPLKPRGPAGEEGGGDVGAVDAALFRENLAEARRASAMAVSPGELAARALGWGKLSLARDQAALVHDADPIDPDARIVLFLLQRREDSGEGLTRCCGDPRAHQQPSLVAKLLLTREIERTMGRDLAEELLVADAQAIRASTDPLVRRLALQD